MRYVIKLASSAAFLTLALLAPSMFPRATDVLAARVAGWSAAPAVAAPADQANLPALSVHGNVYSDEIAELRIYRTVDRELHFYNVSQLSGKQLKFQSRDKDIIARILQAANLGPPVGQPGECGPPEMDYQLHVVTLRAEGRLFGYFVVSPSDALGDAPSELTGNCARVTFLDGKIHGWHSYDFFAELRALGVL